MFTFSMVTNKELDKVAFLLMDVNQRKTIEIILNLTRLFQDSLWMPLWSCTYKRLYTCITITFTKPFSLYSLQLVSSELNRILYDFTHWLYSKGLPCVASFVTTLSSPRSICSHSPTWFDAADQEPVLWLLRTLLSRACQGSCFLSPQDEDAVTAESGMSLFSIPSARTTHSIGKITNRRHLLCKIPRNKQHYRKLPHRRFHSHVTRSEFLLQTHK